MTREIDLAKFIAKSKFNSDMLIEYSFIFELAKKTLTNRNTIKLINLLTTSQTIEVIVPIFSRTYAPMFFFMNHSYISYLFVYGVNIDILNYFLFYQWHIFPRFLALFHLSRSIFFPDRKIACRFLEISH